jgi:hypothetical protein
MNGFFRKTGVLYPFITLSMIGHLLCGYLLVGLGPLNFCAPVSPLNTLSVTIKDPGPASPQPSRKAVNEIYAKHHRPALNIATAGGKGYDSTEKVDLPSPAELSATGQEPASGSYTPAAAQKASDIPEGVTRIAMVKAVRESPVNSSGTVSTEYDLYKGPVRDAGEFLTTKREKLTYRISLLKIPVGTAVMEATNNDGELRINIRITSNAVLSSFYPVDDLVETRMIKGSYLLTRVRQKEGSYQGDFGFTLMLREHKAFWVDRVRNRYDYQPLPGDDVMDVVSGFYFLRKRDLEVGKEEKLNLFDSNEYSPTTIEVLRRERIGLPGSREVDTLVLHPLFKTAGFFRRTGDIMIWLTDDKFRVPVRVETFITLGKVTAELISAVSEKE